MRQKKRQRVTARALNRIAGLFGLALRRLFYYPGLSLLTLVGVVLAVGLVSSAAFFSQAVDKVMMNREMAEYTRITNRPPFSSRVYTFSSREVPLTLARAETLSENVSSTLRGETGLPVEWVGMQVDSGILRLRTASGERVGNTTSDNNVNVMTIRDVAAHITVVEGAPIDQGASGDALDVWVHADMAETMGLQVDERWSVGTSASESFMPIRVAGIWRANDADDPFWLNDPAQSMLSTFLVRPGDYATHMEPLLDPDVRAVTWQVVLDESAAVPARGRAYAEGFARAEAVILKYLPDARLTLPSVSLDKFVERQTALTTLLLGFNVPALGFLLYFLILTSAVVAYWQRRETMILIRRGMNRLEILTLTLLETVIIFLIGCPIGVGFGILLARMMGYTVSFLSFEVRPPLPVSIHGLNLPLIAATFGVILLTKLWSLFTIDRRNIVSQEREHVRPPRPPFWYRAWLDVLLIVPTWYAYRQLTQRGSLALLIEDRPEDLFRDPLLVIVPALFILTLSLISMRVFGVVMRLLDLLSGRVPSISLHLALRQLGRHSHTYINPLLLVIVSLALGVYTLSMAASLDQWLIDRIYYRVGADVAFKPFLESEAMSTEPSVGASWIPPTGDYEALPGVVNAARVGDYQAVISLAGSTNNDARFLAIDRIEFPKVAWFRFDFSRESLGALMNRLAVRPDGVLVSQEFLEANNLRIEDRIQIQVLADFGASVTDDFTIVGTYNHFPTVYEDQVAVVGNLSHIFSYFGMTMPHNIWLHVEEESSGEAVLEVVPDETGVDTRERMDAGGMIEEEQAGMERVGVFGTLSVSFLAATVMAAIGLLTYSFASLQERKFHFAILRAGGMNRGQIVSQVALEYAILTLFGGAFGVLIGSVTAELFVPLFRVTTGGGLVLPPLLPIVAQSEIIPLAGIFAAVMILLEMVLIATALYRRLFESLRMGF